MDLNQLFEEITKKIKNCGWSLNVRDTSRYRSYTLEDKDLFYSFKENWVKEIKSFCAWTKKIYYFPLDYGTSKYYVNLYHLSVIEELKLEKKHPEKKDKLYKIKESEKEFYKFQYEFNPDEKLEKKDEHTDRYHFIPDLVSLLLINDYYEKNIEEKVKAIKDDLKIDVNEKYEVKKQKLAKEQEYYLKESKRHMNFEEMKKYYLKVKEKELKGKNFDEW